MMLNTQSTLRVLLLILVVLLLYPPMMESGIISASHGRIPLDHGNYFEMVRLPLLVKVSKQVNSTFSNGPYNSI